MSIEFYYSPWCRACGGDARRAASNDAMVWIDITRHIEQAVRLGITRPPALVIDGRLVAQGPRAVERLRAFADLRTGHP
ncbi:MAG: glutaredoxin [Xanthomonadaceae bacterium]|nr:glutaredoxin [Xanthomonadaceae bacterium]MDE2316549.1 glutaredoxin [Xanthomonadaceae bacterium]